MHAISGGSGQYQALFQCEKCGQRFAVLYTPDAESAGRWMTALRCPHCRRTQVVAFSPAARDLRVHA